MISQLRTAADRFGVRRSNRPNPGLSVGVAAVVLGGVAWPAVASAQIERPKIENPGLSVTASGSATYDSNIFRTDKDDQRSVDDILVTPGVEAIYQKAVGLNDIKVSADLSYIYYTQNNDRSRARVDIDGSGTLRVAGICQIEPSGRFLRQQADYGDINGPVDNFQTFSTLGVKASCPRTVGFYPFVAATRDTTRNDPLFRFSDQTATAYTAGVGYNRPSLGKATLYYTYLRSDRGPIGVINHVDRAGVTYERAVVTRLQLTADLHYLSARSRGAMVTPYKGLGWDIALIYRPVPTITFKGDTGRRIINDSLVPAGFTVQSDYALDAEWRLAERTLLRARGTYGNRTFRGDPIVLVSPINSDKFTELSLGATRKVGARLDLNGDVRHVTRRTDTNTNEYDVTLGTIGVSYRF